MEKALKLHRISQSRFKTSSWESVRMGKKKETKEFPQKVCNIVCLLPGGLNSYVLTNISFD